MRKVIMYCGIFSMILLSGCIRFGKDTTDTIYLIPEAYEGDLLVLYNVQELSCCQKKMGFVLLLFLQTPVTSTPNMKYGEVNDTYYTVNKEGKRTKLDESCIRVGSNGSTTENIGEENEHTFSYAKLEVTPSACSQSFSSYGREVPENQEHPVEKLRDLLVRVKSSI